MNACSCDWVLDCSNRRASRYRDHPFWFVFHVSISSVKMILIPGTMGHRQGNVGEHVSFRCCILPWSGLSFSCQHHFPHKIIIDSTARQCIVSICRFYMRFRLLLLFLRPSAICHVSITLKDDLVIGFSASWVTLRCPWGCLQKMWGMSPIHHQSDRKISFGSSCTDVLWAVGWFL